MSLSDLTVAELQDILNSRLPLDVDHETFMVAVHQKNLAGFELGQRWNWWESYTDRGPDTPPKRVKLADYVGKELAHVMADLEFFPSLTQARKNGWARPVEPGRFKIGKTRVVIIEA